MSRPIIALRPSKRRSNRSYARHMFEIHVNGEPSTSHTITEALKEIRAVKVAIKKGKLLDKELSDELLSA